MFVNYFEFARSRLTTAHAREGSSTFSFFPSYELPFHFPSLASIIPGPSMMIFYLPISFWMTNLEECAGFPFPGPRDCIWRTRLQRKQFLFRTDRILAAGFRWHTGYVALVWALGARFFWENSQEETSWGRGEMTICIWKAGSSGAFGAISNNWSLDLSTCTCNWNHCWFVSCRLCDFTEGNILSCRSDPLNFRGLLAHKWLRLQLLILN